MGLGVMILGLALFLGAHSLPTQRELRARAIVSLGEGGYKAVYALVSLAGLVLIAWGFALVGTIVLLKVVDLLTGLRVPEEHEIEGLDITQHGEEAYNLES